jgi:hypothetical protein
MAFMSAEPRKAWDALTRHRDLVHSEGECLGPMGKHVELMVTHARLAVLSKELGKADAVALSLAVEECRKASIVDCSSKRVLGVAGRRGAGGRTGETIP